MICFLLPTNDPVSMKKHLLPSLCKVAECRYGVCFAVNFQGYTPEDIALVTDELSRNHFDFKYIESTYPPPRVQGAIKFNKIRHDCATLYPNADVYALLDDDMVFKDGICEVLCAIEAHFKNNPKAGVIQCQKSMFGFGRVMAKPNNKVFCTGYGFFFRNIKSKLGGLVFPPAALECEGGGEDCIIGYSLLHFGYDSMWYTKTAIDHFHNLKQEFRNPESSIGKNMLNSPNGNFTYINDHLGGL